MNLAPADALPPPNELGGPPKFNSWRAEQVDALMRLTGTDKRHICLNMPTGSGKSLVGSMAGRVSGGRTLILTSTKALQNQILRDRLTDADVRGQMNYECLAVRRYGPLADYANRYGTPTQVDKAPCHVGVMCRMKFAGCTYFDAVRDARESDGVVTTNYSYWLALGKMVRDGKTEENLGRFDLLVLDEAHAAVNEVCSALRIELPLAEMHGMLNLKPLPLDATVEAWQSWAVAALMVWAETMDRLSLSLKGQYIEPTIVDEFKVLQQIGAGLEQVSALSGDWVIGMSWKGDKVTFDPVWPTDNTEQLLFRGIPHVLYTSATVIPKTLSILGVPQDDREFIEYPSSFPLKNRPVYVWERDYCPSVKYGMDPDEEIKWVELMDAFIAPRLALGRKGIIHSVSYARMQRIKRLSRFKEFFITHDESSQTQGAIEAFKKSDRRILLSPSITTGEDFPDDQCRWIIVAKLPFTDRNDPIAVRREQADRGYGGSVMMVTLAQSTGRGNRSLTDWCESIIMDGQAQWALPAFQQHAPKYFKSSWKWIRALPAPLEI